MENPRSEIEETIDEIEGKKQPTPTISEKDIRTFDVEMSESIGNLALALAKAQGGMANGAKAKSGYGYKYMELGSLIDIARPELTKNEIAVYQSHELINKKNASVVTHTYLLHSSGEWIKNSLELPVTVMKGLSAAQMIGVVATYGRRYALQAVCLIASEDDTDGTSKK